YGGFQATAPADFQQVTGQAETGYVGHRIHAVNLCEHLAHLVQGRHVLHRDGQVFRRYLTLLGGTGQNAHAQRLGQIQQVTRLGGVVADNAVYRHLAGHRQPENRLWRINTVATGQCNACLGAHGTAAINHLRGNLRRQLIHRPAQNRNRHHRLAAHGVHITDGIRRRNPAEIVRFIHHRHKEIGGADHTNPVADIRYRCGIPAAVTHQQVWVMKVRHSREQMRVQNMRRNLATTASDMAEVSQLDRQGGILLWVEATWLSSQYATDYDATYSSANRATGVRPRGLTPN